MQESLYDTKLNMACFVMLATDGFSRCLPSQYLLSSNFGLFADAQCAKPVLFSYGPLFDPFKPYRIDIPNAYCETHSEGYQGAIQIDKTSLYTNSVSRSTTPSATNFTCGRAAPDSVFLSDTCYRFFIPGVKMQTGEFVSFQ